MSSADFRSDTITKPPREMLAAMAAAEVGDDVFRDDPTVLRLEDSAAERLGREAALFVPSGTMGNQIAIAVWTRPGEEMIAHSRAHCVVSEVAGVARISGVQVRVLEGEDGLFSPAQMQAAIRTDDVHFPRTSLVALEQTHMGCGGRVLPLAHMDEVRRLADQHGLRVHVDGARVFNAAIAAGVNAREYALRADSLTFCASKALSAPVGSVLVGDHDFIEEARRVRKMLGGGMRQVGYLAACALWALDHMVERLAEDHENARRLATGLAVLPGCELDPAKVETNIVILKTAGGEAPGLMARLETEGVRTYALGPSTLRFVTHRHVGASDVERALQAMRALWSDPRTHNPARGN